jgi:hypothetical protein
VRNMEPGEDPNALPPNLPFPALQLSAVGPNTLKTSASAQSIASTASKRTGFLSAFGRLKKEKEVTSLGPPTGSLASLSNQAQSSKRDLRTSSANSGSGGSRRNSVDSTYDQPSPVPFVRPQPQPQPQPQKQPTKAVPRPGGPRGPSEPPVRSSLEAPRPLGSPVGRASLDSPTGSPSRLGGLGGPRALGASSMPSPLARSQNHINHGTSQSQSQSHGHSQSLQSFQIQTPTQSNTPTQPQGPDGFRANEDDVRQFNELVPHAQRPVVRAYLQRYGEMSFAMR